MDGVSGGRAEEGRGVVTSLAVRGRGSKGVGSTAGRGPGGVRGWDFLWAEPLLAAGTQQDKLGLIRSTQSFMESMARGPYVAQ